jgi:hypothetical protein
VAVQSLFQLQAFENKPVDQLSVGEIAPIVEMLYKELLSG